MTIPEPADLAQIEDLRRRYLADQIETATPVQRLLMLFDRLLRDLDEAEEAFGAGEIERISNSLLHAQQIVFALRDPLDRSTPLGGSLASVYSFSLERLIEANLRKKPALLGEVRRLLEPIAAANRAVAQSMVSSNPGGSFEGVA